MVIKKFGDAAPAASRDDKLERVYRRARALEQKYFDGSAPTYVYAYIDDPTYGTAAQAVRDWIKAIWTDYAMRREVIRNGAAWQDVSEDFSSHGEPPYTIWQFP